jgi:hypothetical protein
MALVVSVIPDRRTVHPWRWSLVLLYAEPHWLHHTAHLHHAGSSMHDLVGALQPSSMHARAMTWPRHPAHLCHAWRGVAWRACMRTTPLSRLLPTCTHRDCTAPTDSAPRMHARSMSLSRHPTDRSLPLAAALLPLSCRSLAALLPLSDRSLPLSCRSLIARCRSLAALGHPLPTAPCASSAQCRPLLPSCTQCLPLPLSCTHCRPLAPLADPNAALF